MKSAKFAICCLLVFTAFGCASIPDRLPLRDDVIIPAKTAHLFIVDGLQRSAVQEMLAADELPNITKLFVNEGSTIPNVVVQLPSLTYPNIASLLTGVAPAQHGIYGNQWFNPITLEFVDYASAATYTSVNEHLLASTIHERITDGWTASIQCHTFRGADFVENFPVSTGVRWLTGNLRGVNQQAAAGIIRVAKEANRRQEWPRLVVQYFPGVDEAAHRYGPASPEYRDVIRAVDEQIGAVVRTVEQSLADTDTLFLLVTDHSHVQSPSERRVDFLTQIRNGTGLKIANSGDADGSNEKRMRALADFDAVCCYSNRFATFHVLREALIHNPLPPIRTNEKSKKNRDAIVKACLVMPTVDLVCTLDDKRTILVQSRDGRAKIFRNAGDGKFRYETLDGDPLRLAATSNAKKVQSPTVVSMSANEWLNATRDGAYPDFVPQILGLFSRPRAGDILVFAAEDWSFLPHEAGGHGSALASDCVVTYFARGGNDDLEERVRRSTDVVPVILSHLGVNE